MSSQATPIFVFVEQSKVLPGVCLRNKKGVPLTDLELVRFLISIIQQIDEDRLQMIGTIKEMEEHILQKYGEIYQDTQGK